MWLDMFNLLRKKSGMSLDELSLKSGIPKGTLSKITSGITKNPSIETMRILVHSMGYTLDDLDPKPSDQIISTDSNIQTLIKKYRALDEHGKEAVNSILNVESARIDSQNIEESPGEIIDLMRFLTPASAGSGMVVFGMDYDNLSVVSNVYTKEADYCLPVRGNSMEPRFHDGDLVMIKEQDDVEFGEIGIFIVDGNSYIKQKGDDRLISLNKSVSDVYVSPYQSFKCQGKVIGILDPSWIVK